MIKIQLQVQLHFPILLQITPLSSQLCTAWESMHSLRVKYKLTWVDYTRKGSKRTITNFASWLRWWMPQGKITKALIMALRPHSPIAHQLAWLNEERPPSPTPCCSTGEGSWDQQIWFTNKVGVFLRANGSVNKKFLLIYCVVCKLTACEHHLTKEFGSQWPR